MVDIASIRTQDASTLACDHLMCQSCKVIDRNKNRCRVGYPCPVCGVNGKSGLLAFPVSIHILVDLVQQAFHSESPVGPISGPQVSGVGTVLFFCSLREALLNWFVRGHLQSEKVPDRLIERLFDDNKLARQKFGPLFQSVVGDKWTDAIVKASARDGRDYLPISTLMLQAAEVRNEFLHNGHGWRADEPFARSCLNAVPSLIQLFCALHNTYIHKAPGGDI